MDFARKLISKGSITDLFTWSSTEGKTPTLAWNPSWFACLVIFLLSIFDTALWPSHCQVILREGNHPKVADMMLLTMLIVYLSKYGISNGK